MKRIFTSVIALMSVVTSAFADDYTFTVAALNVDGLPDKIATVSINPDGPGSEGTKLLSQRLASKDYDIFGVSEDFNFDSELMSSLSGTYDCGKWRGKIAPNVMQALQILSQSWRADTDGLNLIWKKNLNVTDESWTLWNKWNGYTDNGADGLIKKGYRYYCAEVAPGVMVDIYILHMDAETTDADNAARDSQIEQLVAAIKATDNKRPVIIMGDTNCRYTRDKLESNFIGGLNADSRFTAKDGWIEYCKGGYYPALGTNALMVNDLGYVKGEIVDKIFFVNNKDSKYLLKLEEFKVDTDFNKADGTPLSDHYPVVARFTISDTYNPEEADDVSPEELLKDATADNPVDATSLIVNPDFEYGQAGWQNSNASISFSVAGNGDNWNAERYYQDAPSSSAWDIYQIIDVPNGVYKLTAQAFYRDGWADANATAYKNGTEHIRTSLYANAESTKVKSVYSENEASALYMRDGDGLSDFNTVLGYIPNGQTGASAYFSKGHYPVEVDVTVTDGKLRLGIRKEAGGSPSWTCFDNFTLTYYGEPAPAPTYTVEFVIDGETVKSEELEEGTAVVAPVVEEREGYTFSWDKEIPATATENVTITGVYTINQYTVKFVVDGESLSEQTLDYGTEIAAPEVPGRDGCSFAWNQDVPSVVLGDVVITGSYTPNKYTVKFVIDGNVVSEQTLEYGTEITAPEVPELDGFQFDGWDNLPATVPSEDIIIEGTYSIIVPEIA